MACPTWILAQAPCVPYSSPHPPCCSYTPVSGYRTASAALSAPSATGDRFRRATLYASASPVWKPRCHPVPARRTSREVSCARRCPGPLLFGWLPGADPVEPWPGGGRVVPVGFCMSMIRLERTTFRGISIPWYTQLTLQRRNLTILTTRSKEEFQQPPHKEWRTIETSHREVPLWHRSNAESLWFVYADRIINIQKPAPKVTSA